MLLVVRYVLLFWGTVARERPDLVLENIAPRHLCNANNGSACCFACCLT